MGGKQSHVEKYRRGTAGILRKQLVLLSQFRFRKSLEAAVVVLPVFVEVCDGGFFLHLFFFPST